MARTLQEPIIPEDGDRIVITGMAGVYPEANHVKELENILYNKINPVTDEKRRWSFTHPEVRNHIGKIPGVELMDAQFFKVHYRLAICMDAMSRRMLEQAYQAIYDSGINPESLSGKKVGVYVGTCFSETEKTCFYVASSRTGFGIAGCNKSMFANRISYWLNAKGPSMSLDEGCCSSMAALEQAYLAIERGECEAAVIGGANLTLHPQTTIHAGRVVLLAPDGKTKSFDENADGCAKSEAVNVLFLQKARDAKRIYAEVLHVKSIFSGFVEEETGPKYGFYRDPVSLAEFFETFYKEAKFDPAAVEYVEAFGSADPEVDKAELEALDLVFCKDRTTPLLVGSVMSNIGYGEAASGISAITKVLLGYHNGELAGNLHCSAPRQDVAALRAGRLQLLTDHRRFRGALTAVNGISVTGVNAHVLLNGHYKPKDNNRYRCDYPRLVTISGRQESAVQKILDDLKTRPIDLEECALFHNIHQNRISGHLGRGYTVLGTSEEGQTISLSEKANYFDDATRPLWFVYSGMGSQWAGMGAQLMRIPIFAAAIERCRKVLEPRGVDIIHIITFPDKAIFDNILNSFVGIAAVQIGLTDILTALGIVPDKIIGHSVGELGCAYADGCFTAEQMILSAYSRGLVSVQTPLIKGSMAAVGVGYEKISKLVPPEIEVACHNGPESSTISGPADVMKEFVAQLTAQGIFAREVPCSNIAYHSRYIADAGPGLLKYLSDVIKDPKPRSDRWVSTSVPMNKWNEPQAKLSSAFYHTNNLLNPVLFEETSQLIPNNAVLVEIAPHGLLQAILKRSLPETCRQIPLTRREHKDNVLMVLDAIGKLYLEGYNPRVQALYPEVEFPVSTGTPMLGHLVEWAHHEKWSVPFYVNAHKKMAPVCNFVISLHDSEYNYLQGHVIREKNVYPLSAALVAAWDTLAMYLNAPRKSISVEFRDVRLWAQPLLLERRPLRFSVALHRASGRFEVLEEDHLIVSGAIFSGLHDTTGAFKLPFESKDKMDITKDDIYKVFYTRDYSYRDDFRSIHKVNQSLTEAQIVWDDNWVTFLDGILQLSALRDKHDTVSQIHTIRRLHIDTKEHINTETFSTDGKLVKLANVFELDDFLRCGGVAVYNIKFRKLPLLDDVPVDLKSLNFIPRFQKAVDVSITLQVYLQIVAENINKKIIAVKGISNGNKELPIFNQNNNIFDHIPDVTVKYENLTRSEMFALKDVFIEADVVLVKKLSEDDKLCQILYRVLPRNAFLINDQETSANRERPSTVYRVVSSNNIGHTNLQLIKWRPTQKTSTSSVVSIRNKVELEMLEITQSSLPKEHRLVILAPYPAMPGLKDLVQKWREDQSQVNLVMVSERDNIDVLPDLDLTFNVLKDGIWGGEYLISCQDRLSPERGVALRMSRIEDLDSLHWVEAREPDGSGIAVTVHYVAINDADVKRATGVIPFLDGHESSYCMDFSGVTDTGERVMGLLQNGAASSRVKVRPEMLWPVPDHWTLEDAATVPSAFVHAFYCFDLKVQFKRGYSVLVHGAAGALGQAALSVALAHGCEVFATVSDVRKKRFLMKMFPHIKEDHIGNSRDTSFGDMVGVLTKGKGCDVVFCTVKGELKNISLSCTGEFGICLDIGQIPSQENFIFRMDYLSKERNYKPIDFSSMLAQENVEEMRRIQMLLCTGINQGYVRPLSRVVYPARQVSRAFRLLAASKHRGRVLLKLGQIPTVEPRIDCSPDSCQLVIYDDDNFGLQLIERLIKRGARKLYLCTRKPSNILRLKLQSWEKNGVKVQVSNKELYSNKDVVHVINESNRLGVVEGIYVIATNEKRQKIDSTTALLNDLDLSSRKLCPNIRYFATVSVGLPVGQHTCHSRLRDGLPAVSLNIPALKKFDFEDLMPRTALSLRSAVNATERALRSSQSVLEAHAQPAQQPKLLQQIAKIADIEIAENIRNDITLQELNVERAKNPAICSYLRDTHNIALAEESVLQLSIQKLKDLENMVTGHKLKEVHGLETFFTFVDPDELLATTEVVSLPTLTRSGAMREDEFDVNVTFLCIIPGMEGHHNRFRVLCERLKLPALVLQPGLDHLKESPKETAERFTKILLDKYGIKKNFYLLGYESGVEVALDMAAILEDHGFKGTVFCLGGTPEDFRAVLEKELSGIRSEDELHDAIVRHMFGLMTDNVQGLDEALQNSRTWEEKVEACVRMLLGRVPHSAQYARSWMQAAHTRVRQARRGGAGPARGEGGARLHSQLVLLRAGGLPSPAALAELQARSHRPLRTHQLEETFPHAAQDLRCSDIINSHLHPDILKAFDESNLCETYLLNAHTLMEFDDDAHVK